MLTLAVLGALWALWPIVTLAGGLGFSVLSGVAAGLLLPTIARSLRPRLYFAVLVIFFVFVGVSSAWSPRDQVLVEIDLGQLKFAVRSEMLRVGLQILAQGCLMAAAMRLTDSRRIALQRIAHVALSVQLVVLVVLTLFEQQVLAALTAIVPDAGESVQNISRNSLIMAVAAPVFAIGAASGHRAGRAVTQALLIFATVAAVLVVREVHTGLLALFASACAIAIVYFLPRFGFKLMGLLVAALIMSAPFAFGMLTNGADFATADDSASYRAAIWQHVIAMINEHPLTGGGVGVLRTVTDTIDTGVFAGQLKVPNHSHNMMLQVWAETGAVGAGLLSLAILLAAWRIPDARKIGPSALKGAALVGGMIAVAAVSFDVWNEWWWAVGGLLAVLTIASPREAPTRRTEHSSGIVFDGGLPHHDSASVVASAEPADREGVVSIPADPPNAASNSTSLSQIAPSTNNNFHLLRLLLALAVVAYHAALLPGVANWQPAESPLSLAAELGVQGFFVVSGYLVWTSLERSSSVRLYAEKRIRRLVPAYASVVFGSAILALAVSEEARADIASVARYVGWNLAFLNFMEPSLPGLFEANRFTEVNGALWTLKIEVLFYVALPIIGSVLAAAGRYRWLVMVFIYAGAEAWRISLEQMSAANGGAILMELSRQLPGQLSFFITGIALAAWREELNWKSALVPVALMLLVASIAIPSLEFLRAAGVGIIVVWVAVGLPRLFDAARFGDFSYGLYVAHFPIIQGLVAAGVFVATPWFGLASALAASLVAAALLWWLVERPVLRSDSAYRMP